MRLVIDGRMILPNMTGVGRYVLGLAPALVEGSSDLVLELWVQPGLPAHHPVWSLPKKDLILRELPVRHMSLWGTFSLPNVLRSSKSDLFHLPHFDLPWYKTSKMVTTIHDLKYIVRPDFFPHMGKVKKSMIRLMITNTCRKAEYVITDSASTAQDLMDHLSISSEKIKVIPLGVSPLYFKDISRKKLGKIRKKYRISKPFILFVGERRPHKNLEGLIKAFATFCRMTSSPYQLVIGGRPYSDYRRPEQMAADLQLNDRVIFIDNLSDDDLPGLYQASESFVLLSYYEGFGLPVLEAMASGTPVVASNRTSLPEVCRGAAILVPPDNPERTAEAIRQVIKGGQYRDQQIHLGKIRASEMSWENCAQFTMDVYTLAVAKRVHI